MAASDTIFALSSGQGRAGVAVIRVSGPRTRFVVETMARTVSPAREARLTVFRDAAGGVIDRGLLLRFDSPHSFTGEDCAEFHVHGGRAVIAAMLARLGELDGCRLAQPGEFTRRALENGKLDLLAAEALIDLIDAETEQQRQRAMAHHAARRDRTLLGLHGRLLDVMARLEAEIEFSDEPDVEVLLDAGQRSALEAIKTTIEAALANSARSERLRGGFRVVLAGAPNAGKSSLFNAIARRDAAIVSPVPGTTRDTLELHLDLSGWPVTLIDTAGLRESDDPVEQLGIDRTYQALSGADLVIHLSDDGVWTDLMIDAPVIRVRSKVDSLADREAEIGRDLGVSSETGHGLDDLLGMIEQEAASGSRLEADVPIVSARKRGSLNEARVALTSALGHVGQIELVVEDLRRTSRALSDLIDPIDSEAVLSAVFSRFCIGK